MQVKNNVDTGSCSTSRRLQVESATPAGCSKWPLISPAQPRRTKTRRSAGKAAASEKARHTLGRMWSL